MGDFFWSSQNPNGQDVRCEGGEVVHVDPKSIGSIAADAGNFVWQPGGVQGGNVYNNWPDLAKAIALVRGQKTVTVNTTTAAAHVTTGAWPGITDVTFLGGETSPIAPVVTVDDGATFTSTRKLTLDSVVFSYAGTLAPCIADTATSIEVNCTNEAVISQTGGQAFVSIGTNVVLMITNVEKGAGWAAGTLAVGAGCTLEVLATSGGFLAAGAATGLGTIIVFSDGASLPGTGGGVNAQTGVTTNSVEVTDPQPTFVFKPGATGTLNGNVFTTWATLMAATALVPGPRTILVDDTIAAAHATTGTWNVDNIDFVSVWNSNSTLIVDDGSVWTGSFFSAGQGLIFSVAATTATGVIKPTGGAFFGVALRENASIVGSVAGAAFFVPTGGATIEVMLNGSSILGDGVHPIGQIAAGQTIFVQQYDHSLTSALAFTGLGTLDVTQGADSPVGVQTGLTTLTTHVQARASLVAYTATAGANWNPIPTLTSAALDQLAAPNSTQASGQSGTGTGTVTVTTGNVTKALNGRIVVMAVVTGTTAAATTVTLQLVRDAATNIGNPVVVTTLSAGDGFTGVVFFADTAPDNAAHTYKCTATAGAGNITIPGANSAQILAFEL